MSSAPHHASSCDYCGLPVAVARVESATNQSLSEKGSDPLRRGQKPSEIDSPPKGLPPFQTGSQYCCFGCRVAAAVANETGEEGRNRWTLTRLGLAIFCSMNVMVFTLALWSTDVYRDPTLASPAALALFELFRFIGLFFSVIVVLLLGGPLLESAWEQLRRGSVTTDLLIVVGVVAALLYSVVSLFSGGQHTYFEVACTVLVGVTLGRWLEATGKLRTTNALRALEKLLPTEVRLLEYDLPDNLSSCTERTIPLEQLQVGDCIRVLPGERIAVDGQIRRGHAAVDEQIVTGESLPSVKEPGDGVFAGSLNLDGDLFITATASPREGALLRIVDAVVQAATAKGRLQRTADRITRWFVPTIILVAVGAFIAHAWLGGLGSGLMVALAILLIACPCALGIATPLALWAAMGRASESGVLFRHGDALQQLAATQAVCFDKTGTLTTGTTTVDQLVVDPETSREQLLGFAGTLASASTHGLSVAIRTYVSAALPEAGRSCGEVTTQTGRGLVATVDPDIGPVHLGNLAFLEEAGLTSGDFIRQAVDAARLAGQPVVCIGWQQRVRGLFTFHESLREETQEALDELQQSGFHVAILTGDHAVRAASLVRTLGIAIQTQLLPEAKLAAIRTIRAQHGVVVMVGDGINDAPALAAADVGIAMGCGADVSRDAADVCLLGNDLRHVGWSIDLARRTMRTVRQNLFWAFAYNLVGVGLAVMGWLNPIWAAVAMVGSSLFVIGNSLRLAHTPLANSTDFLPMSATEAWPVETPAATDSLTLPVSPLIK